jgi:hypothetical protein
MAAVAVLAWASTTFRMYWFKGVPQFESPVLGR